MKESAWERYQRELSEAKDRRESDSGPGAYDRYMDETEAAYWRYANATQAQQAR